MSSSRKKLCRYNRTKFIDSDDSDEELQSEAKSPTPREESKKNNENVENEGYKTGHYQVAEQMEMVNFLIDNQKISCCCSMEPWIIMASQKKARSAHSLHVHFRKMIAPNIAMLLKTMHRIGEPGLLEEFREALTQAQIIEHNNSAVLSADCSLSRSDSNSSGVTSRSPEAQKPIDVKLSTVLDEMMLSSEEETEINKSNVIKVPSLNEFSQTANTETPVLREDRIKKERKKSIVVKVASDEDEGDVVFIEAVDRKNIVIVLDESCAEKIIVPPYEPNSNEKKDSPDCASVKEKNEMGRVPKIRVIAEAALSRGLHEDPVPSTSGGLSVDGYQASEYNHLWDETYSDSDSDEGFISTKPPLNEVAPAERVVEKEPERNEKIKRAEPDEDYNPESSVSNDSDDESDADCPRSVNLWSSMYGPVTVRDRQSGKRLKFTKDFNMIPPDLPPNCEFSEGLLNQFYKDLMKKPTVAMKGLIVDLALLHYFICRPAEFASCGGRPVYRRILQRNWKIFQNKTMEGLRSRFNNYVRGYIDKFGLPNPVLDEFMYCEWQRSLGNIVHHEPQKEKKMAPTRAKPAVLSEVIPIENIRKNETQFRKVREAISNSTRHDNPEKNSENNNPEFPDLIKDGRKKRKKLDNPENNNEYSHPTRPKKIRKKATVGDDGDADSEALNSGGEQTESVDLTVSDDETQFPPLSKSR